MEMLENHEELVKQNRCVYCGSKLTMRVEYDKQLRPINKQIRCPKHGDYEKLLQTEMNSIFSEKLIKAATQEMEIGYDAAIKKNPKQAPELHYNKGTNLSSIGRYDDAIKEFDKAIKLNPKFADAYSNKGVALARQGKSEEAITAYNIAIKLNPKMRAAHTNKGLELCVLSRYADAIKELDIAIKLDPNHAETHSAKGCALDDIGKHKESLKEFDIAIRLEPNNSRYKSLKNLALKRMNEG